MMTEVEVSLPDEPGAPSTLMGLWVVCEHHQVLVCIAAQEGQRAVVHQVLNTIHLQRLVVPRHQRQRSVLFLEAQDEDGLADVSTQDEALDAAQLVGVDLCVNEGHAHQVCVLQLPDVHLLSNGRHQQAAAVSQGGDGTLLLPLVQHFQSVFSEGLAGLRHYVNHVKDDDAATTGDVLTKAVQEESPQ